MSCRHRLHCGRYQGFPASSPALARLQLTRFLRAGRRAVACLSLGPRLPSLITELGLVLASGLSSPATSRSHYTGPSPSLPDSELDAACTAAYQQVERAIAARATDWDTTRYDTKRLVQS